MIKTYATFGELTSDLAFDLIDALAADGITAEFGASNQSCSRYCDVSAEDEDGDVIDNFKVRFSDHADHHGSDITIRIDELIETITDEDGEYVSTTIEADRYADALDLAKAAALAGITRLREEA